MAVMTLEFRKHWRFYIRDDGKGFRVITELAPEVSKWMSQNAVQHSLIKGREMKICILNNQKAMLFKLTWL